MFNKFHFCKVADLYDCGTATFGIAKGKIQSVLKLVIRDPGGRKGNSHTDYGDVPLKDLLIEWGLRHFQQYFSYIVAV